MRPVLLGLLFVGLAGCQTGAPSNKAPEPTPEQPVVAWAMVDPTSVRPGEPFTLSIRLRIAPTWHIDPRGGGDNASAATTISIELGEDMEALTDWEDPAPERDPTTGAAILTGEVSFTRMLRVSGGQIGTHEISVSVRCRACDPYKCRPAESLIARTTFTVKSR